MPWEAAKFWLTITTTIWALIVLKAVDVAATGVLSWLS